MSVHFFLDKRPDTNCLRETQIFLPPLRGALVDHYTPGSHSPGARPTAEAVERSGRTGGLMGRSGPSASQAGEVSTAGRRIGTRLSSTRDSLQKGPLNGDCSIATGADSKIARQEQGESTWDPLNACELAPNSANSLIPSLIAWAKSQPPGNVAIVSLNETRRSQFFRCSGK